MKYIYSIYSLVLIFTIFIPLDRFGLYDKHRLIQLSLFCVISIICISYYSSNVRNKYYLLIPKTIAYPTLLFILFGLVSSIKSENSEFAFFELSFHLLLLFVILLITPVINSDKTLLSRIIIFSAIGFTFLYIIVFIYNYFGALNNSKIPIWPEKIVNITLDSGQKLRVYYNNNDVLYFSNRRIFNHVQTLTLPLIFAAFIHFKKVSKTKFAIFIFLLISGWWMLIFASGARGSFFSLIIGFLSLVILAKMDIKVFIKPLLFSALLGLFFYLLLFLLIPENGNNQSLIRSSSSGRLEIWLYSLKLWWQNPLFGVGPYHFAKLNCSVSVASPHNIFLTYLSEWGVFAVLILIYLVFRLIVYVRSLISSIEGVMYYNTNLICISWSILSGFFHSLVSGIYLTPFGQLWGLLILSWIFGHYQNSKIRSNDVLKINKWKISIVFTTVLLIFIYQLIFNVEFPLHLNESSYYPRFWEQGKFY